MEAKGDNQSTPRVNYRVLNKYIGATVRLVGAVKTQQQNRAILATSDDGEVVVHTIGNPYSSPYMEVLGTVNNDLSVSEISSTSFGDSFDLANYEQLVQFMQLPQFKSLFA